MKHKLIMENWRKFTETSTLNENLTPQALRISPNFKSQGTLSRLKSRFTRKKDDQSIDQETGKNKLKQGHPGHQFQFYAFYRTPGGDHERYEVGPPIDYASRYKGTISSEDDIKKLWNFILKEDDRFGDRLRQLSREMNLKWGQGKWKIHYAYAMPNDLIDASVAFQGTYDMKPAQEELKDLHK